MKVKELIEVLSEFNQELEVCELEWSEWDIDYVYYRYKQSPTLVSSKKFNKQWDKEHHIEEKHFVCL